MKKILAVLCMVLMSSGVALAGPHHHGGHGGHGGHRPPVVYHHGGHHHHHNDVAAGIAVGLIGGTIINSLLQPRAVYATSYAPVTYTTSPTIITQPAVVQAPVVVSTPSIITQPCYRNTNLVTGATTSSCY